MDNAFVFSDKYRVWRHVTFWLVQAGIVSFLFKIPGQSFISQFLLSLLWVPALMIFAYPVMYLFIPFLIKGKYEQFITIMIIWGAVGWFWNFTYRSYIYFPIADRFHYQIGVKNPWAPVSYLTMNVMAGFGGMIVLFKYWMKKQKDFLLAEKEKVNAELQLLKAQVHPHFLFNTLNNIYSFALQNSSKTPELVLKLSSLLSYMLYDCKAQEVLLEKELQIMANYIDLEKERYTKLEVSLNFEGDVKDKWIAPLLLLPFLENAFKHGTSEQLEKPWLSIDVSVKQNMLLCKIANSKNEMTLANEKGIGIENVMKRLVYLYPGKHELKLNDEGNFFVVSLGLELHPISVATPVSAPLSLVVVETIPI